MKERISLNRKPHKKLMQIDFKSPLHIWQRKTQPWVSTFLKIYWDHRFNSISQNKNEKIKTNNWLLFLIRVIHLNPRRQHCLGASLQLLFVIHQIPSSPLKTKIIRQHRQSNDSKSTLIARGLFIVWIQQASYWFKSCHTNNKSLTSNIHSILSSTY